MVIHNSDTDMERVFNFTLCKHYWFVSQGIKAVDFEYVLERPLV